MRLFISSISLLSMVSLARSGCTENQYGKDGCEPDPFLCRYFTFDYFSCSLLLKMTCFSRITCEKDEPCVLEEFDDQTPTCANANVTLPQDYGSFAEDLCRADCAKSDEEEDDAKRCRFWRFVSRTLSEVGLIFISRTIWELQRPVP